MASSTGGSAMQEDQRECIRVPLATVALITKVGEDVSRPVRVHDLGIKGMGIYTHAALRKEDQLLIELALPTAQNEAEIVSVPGEVAWIEPIQEGVQYLVGIKFYLLFELESKLQKYIDHIEKALNIENNEFNQEQI
ncbi:MAG: PilZ domain-containing protein [Nitrospirae bacterium]|nr:PilZ domain-containing protein [Candidatus Manganitrophaceae bacterium]